MRVPDLEAVGMLGGQLASASRRHAHDEWDAYLSAGHVTQSRSVVQHLVHRQHTEIYGHHFDDWPHAVDSGADTCPDKRRFRQRSVKNTFAAELRKQTVAYSKRASVAADVLPHQEDARVRAHRVPHRRAGGLPVAQLGHRTRLFSRSSTGSKGLSSANFTASSIVDLMRFSSFAMSSPEASSRSRRNSGNVASGSRSFQTSTSAFSR